MVTLMEKAQALAAKSSGDTVGEELPRVPTPAQGQEPDFPSLLVRSSTPVPAKVPDCPQASLSALESGLRMAESSRTPLQELLPTSDIPPRYQPQHFYNKRMRLRRRYTMLLYCHELTQPLSG